MKRYYFGTNPLGPSRKVKAAIRKAAKEVNTLPVEVQTRLERLFLSKYGTARDSILFANSLKELLFVICRSLQPRRILIVGPALNICQEAAQASGVQIETLSCNEESLFFPEAGALVEKAGGGDLVVIANPNRITGKILSDSILKQALAALSLKDCVTVIDESLIGFTGEEGCIRRAVNSNNMIVLRTTACYFGLPGLELASAVAGPKVIERLRPGILSGPSIPAMAAALTALKDKSYRRATELFMHDEKRLLGRAISRMAGMVVYESDTNVFLLNASDLAPEIERRADRACLAVERCSERCGLNETFLRISVMKHDHNLKLIKLLKGLSVGGVREKSTSD